MTARRASAAPLLDVEGSPISFPSEAFTNGRECITKSEWERRFALAHPDRKRTTSAPPPLGGSAVRSSPVAHIHVAGPSTGREATDRRGEPGRAAHGPATTSPTNDDDASHARPASS